MSTIIQQTRLECVNSQHDKFYEVTAEDIGGNTPTYRVTARWGRNGHYNRGGQTKVYYEGSSRHEATTTLNDLVRIKTAKGYVTTGSTQAPDLEHVKEEPAPRNEATKVVLALKTVDMAGRYR